MIQALRNEIIVKPFFLDIDTVGSIIIPKSAQKYKQYDTPVRGEVVSIGPRYRYRDQIKIGDTVIWENYRNSGGGYEGVKFVYEGVTYLKLKEKWVHAVIPRQNELAIS